MKRSTFLTGIFVTAALLLLTSCGSQLSETQPIQETPSSGPVYKTAMEPEALIYEETDPYEAEQQALAENSRPYFDAESPLFAGNENTYFLQAFLFPVEENLQPVSVKDFEQALRLLFHLTGEDAYIKAYISDFAQNDTIERQYATAGFMKLLTLKYPLTLEDNNENLKKSDAIEDMTSIEPANQILVRQAYCLYFTDYTVNRDLRFRPTELLSHSEAVSMIAHVLDHFGPPAVEPAEEITALAEEAPSPSPGDESEELDRMSLYEEIQTYRDKLKKSGSQASKRKAELLELAQHILGASSEAFETDAMDSPVSVKEWKMVFEQCFSIKMDDISPYISHESGDLLTYDMAAISIIQLSAQTGTAGTQEASDEELENARLSIPQFETARDISKLALMHARGFLDGICTMPGFTPQRPVHRAEAMLLVKRLFESMK